MLLRLATITRFEKMKNIRENSFHWFVLMFIAYFNINYNLIRAPVWMLVFFINEYLFV